MIGYIHEHLTESIRLVDLATVAGCSANQMGRLFQLAFRESPMQYVMRRRLERAAQQLQQTRHSVTMIALDCGFSDGNYLSKQFKKHYHMSPREWRSACERRRISSDDQLET